MPPNIVVHGEMHQPMIYISDSGVIDPPISEMIWEKDYDGMLFLDVRRQGTDIAHTNQVKSDQIYYRFGTYYWLMKTGDIGAVWEAAIDDNALAAYQSLQTGVHIDDVVSLLVL